MAAVTNESVKGVVKKETASALACCKPGGGHIKINGCPYVLLEPEIIRQKTKKTITGFGLHHFDRMDMEVIVQGGGLTSQTYAIQQAIAKALVAFYQKYDKSKIKEIKDKINRFDSNLLVNELGGRGSLM